VAEGKRNQWCRMTTQTREQPNTNESVVANALHVLDLLSDYHSKGDDLKHLKQAIAEVKQVVEDLRIARERLAMLESGAWLDGQRYICRECKLGVFKMSATKED